MALKKVEVTLSGATRVIATHTPVRQVFIQNRTGNAAARVGPSTVAATTGISIAAGAIQELGPFSGDAPLNLDEVFLIGTDTQVLDVVYITH